MLLGTFYDLWWRREGIISKRGQKRHLWAYVTMLLIFTGENMRAPGIRFFFNRLPTTVMRTRDKYSKTFNNNTFLIFVGSLVFSCANFLTSIKCVHCCTAEIIADRFGTKLQYLMRNYQESWYY